MNETFRDAAIYEDFDTVQEEIRKFKEVVNETDEHGFTVLHDVVGESNKEMIELLIGNGANVNAQNDEGIAPMHLVAYGDFVGAILAAGADINIRSNHGLTPLHIHVENRETFDVVEALLEHGADVNALSKDQKTALDVALLLGDDKKVSLLRRYGGQASSELL